MLFCVLSFTHLHTCLTASCFIHFFIQATHSPFFPSNEIHIVIHVRYVREYIVVVGLILFFFLFFISIFVSSFTFCAFYTATANDVAWLLLRCCVQFEDKCVCAAIGCLFFTCILIRIQSTWENNLKFTIAHSYM